MFQIKERHGGDEQRRQNIDNNEIRICEISLPLPAGSPVYFPHYHFSRVLYLGNYFQRDAQCFSHLAGQKIMRLQKQRQNKKKLT